MKEVFFLLVSELLTSEAITYPSLCIFFSHGGAARATLY